jgi:hypothetical protein
MPWLLRDDEVLAAIEVTSRLAGRSGLDGALLVQPARTVHTIGLGFAVDVAYCRRGAEGSLVVLATRAMHPWRIGRPRPRADCVIAAERGAFERWGLAAGDELVVR